VTAALLRQLYCAEVGRERLRVHGWLAGGAGAKSLWGCVSGASCGCTQCALCADDAHMQIVCCVQ
jgi:hypothetical protein